ncbi:galactokinase family protein [Mariniluteicoccus flavus]
MTPWRVPGRLEVLGKHTDYCGGNVLVCAIDRGITLTVEPAVRGIEARSDFAKEPVTLRSPSERSESRRVERAPLRSPSERSETSSPSEYFDSAAGGLPQQRLREPSSDLPPGHWGRYLQVVVDRLTANFGPLQPCRISVTSDLPPASGMSSSSALVVAATLALADLNGFSDSPLWKKEMPTPIELAAYLATVENGKSWKSLEGDLGVGTLGGSEDHTAMVCGEPGMLTQFSFDPLQKVRSVALPDDLTFVVAVSGVLAEKTGTAQILYNRASLAATAILNTWNQATGRNDASLAAALREDPGAERLTELVKPEPELGRRLHQFVRESTVIVPEAVKALEARDLEAFGALVDESQRLSETHLGNQVPETVALARQARELGAYAASAFGAGFGGSVWALVDASRANSFGETWSSVDGPEYPGGTLRIFPAPGAR